MQNLLILTSGLIFGFMIGRWSGTAPPTVESPPTTVASKAEPIAQPPSAPSARPTPPNEATVAATSSAAAPIEDPEPEDSEPAPKEAVAPSDAQSERPAPQVTPASVARFSQLRPAVADKLERTRRENFRKTLRSATPVSVLTPNVQGLMGHFEGDILIDEQNGRTWQIEIENSGTIKAGVLRGKSRSRLFRNGRPFLTSEQEGQLKGIRTVGDGKSSFILLLSDQYYLEGFHDPGTDTLNGNFYAKNPKGGISYRGPAQLSRVP